MEQRIAGQRFRLPALMGHRGAAGLAPENTLASLRAAKAAGCTWVELDVMLSRDGVPVLHHDITLRRTAGYLRRLRSLTAKDLQALDVGRKTSYRFSGERILTLEEALREAITLDLMVNLELKTPPRRSIALVDAALAVLRDVWPENRPKPLLSSFYRRCLAHLQAHGPAYPRALIATRFPSDWRRTMEDLDCVALHLNRRHVTVYRVGVVRAAGFGFAAFTVNDPKEARLFQSWGVDCLVTDLPQVITPALSRPALTAFSGEAESASPTGKFIIAKP